jgi:ferredoxin
MPGYRVSVDLEACDGVFACLVRDGRFAEADDGLVTLPGGDRSGGELRATFDDDRRDDAERAAAACPLDAISVEGRAGERSESPERASSEGRSASLGPCKRAEGPRADGAAEGPTGDGREP